MSEDRPNNDDESKKPEEPHQPEFDGLSAGGDDESSSDGEAPENEKARPASEDSADPEINSGAASEDCSLDEREDSTEPSSVANRKQEPAVESSDSNDLEDDYLDRYPDDYAEEGEEDGEGMSFLDHLEEFRWTLGRSALAFVVGILVVVFFHKDISVLLQLPLNTAYGSAEVASKNLITYKAMGVIMVLLQIALLGGLTLSMPFVLYFLGSFIAPGLTEKERRILRPACFAAFLLFIAGVLFAFYIILPLALGFTVRLNQHLGFDIFWAASDYYNMVVWFSLGIGAFFQFPLIVVILVFIGVLSTATLKRVRRAVFVGLMVFSALVSPGGDPLSLGVTTGFMYLLYELAIWIGGRLEAKKLAEENAQAWPDGPPDDEI